jgi:hypothetical protein
MGIRGDVFAATMDHAANFGVLSFAGLLSGQRLYRTSTFKGLTPFELSVLWATIKGARWSEKAFRLEECQTTPFEVSDAPKEFQEFVDCVKAIIPPDLRHKSLNASFLLSRCPEELSTLLRAIPKSKRLTIAKRWNRRLSVKPPFAWSDEYALRILEGLVRHAQHTRRPGLHLFLCVAT